MMVETILESSQDFGTAGGALPQWKRELLQRRAQRRPPAAAPPPPPPPPPPPALEDEELRYGPGIVKRLKSRYLSLALRDAPRRRPSVLRRAASLEHLLDEHLPDEHLPDERPPPAPRPAPRPAPHPARRDSVKRARSVDAAARLASRDERAPPSPSPPPAPGRPRAARLPRRPAPLLRDAERPPPDVVRSALRKFEAAPPRRAPPPAPRAPSASPEPPAPSPDGDATDDAGRAPPPEPAAPDRRSASPRREDAEARAVSRAALDNIGRAGTTVRYSFAGAAPRRVGVIRPMPAAAPQPRPPAPSPGRIVSAGVERAWSGSEAREAPRARVSPRPHSAAPTSVVFDFSSRKEVPDYIENDGLVLRSSRRRQSKKEASEDGAGSGSESEGERAPSPCAVRFVNDNVLINGRSSLAPRRRPRLDLKLQFDDSLTRTHEYPSETSLCEECPSPPDALRRPAGGPSALAAYTPHNTPPEPFQLGVTRRAASPPRKPPSPPPPPAAPRPWAETRALAADLLF